MNSMSLVSMAGPRRSPMSHSHRPGDDRGAISNSQELSRLLSAAVVSRRFCHLLLTDAETALAEGYNGEEFHLTPEEQHHILSIRATFLEEFARQLLDHAPSDGYRGAAARQEADQRQDISAGHASRSEYAAGEVTDHTSRTTLVNEVTAQIARAFGRLSLGHYTLPEQGTESEPGHVPDRSDAGSRHAGETLQHLWTELTLPSTNYISVEYGTAQSGD